MMTRWTALTVAAALAGAVVAWLGLSAGFGAGTAAGGARAPSAPSAAPWAAAPVLAVPEANAPQPAGSAAVPVGQPAPDAAVSGQEQAAADAGAAAAPAANGGAASPEQRAAAQALVLASFNSTPAVVTAQPAPVDLRRNHRQQTLGPSSASEPVLAADTGLRDFPGAVALPGQSSRNGRAVTATSQAHASFKHVRDHFAAQLQPSADGVRQLTVLADDEQVYDARVVDLNRKTVQRVQLAAGDAFVVVQLSHVHAR